MHTTDAIVLSSRPSGEHDTLVSFFTRDFGKVAARVRASRKHTSKQGNFLHSFGLLRISFILGKGGPILSGVTDASSAQVLAGHLFAQAYLHSFFLLCDKLMYEYAPEDRIWALLQGALDDAERIAASKASEAAKRSRLWEREKVWIVELLSALGVGSVRLEGIHSRAQMDSYLSGLLRSRFDVPTAFFGATVGASR